MNNFTGGGGPYFEAFKARNVEVLYLYEPIDEFVMNHARAFEEKSFISADADGIDLEAIAPETETDKEEALATDAVEGLCAFIKEKLEFNTGRITMEELETYIKKTKYGKAPGPDGIPMEFFKALDDDMKHEILSILNKWWSEENIPEEVLTARVVLL